MTNVIARHVNETDSDRRGIKDGWYAISQMGRFAAADFRIEKLAKRKSGESEPILMPYRHGADTLFTEPISSVRLVS